MGQFFLVMWATLMGMPRLARLGVSAFVVGSLSLGAVAGGWALTLQLSGNFHEVVAGEFYRSKRLDAEQLIEEIDSKGIRTVINLLGEKPGVPWFEVQKAVLESRGVTLVSMPWSDRREPTTEEIEAYVRIVQNAPKPILVHCKADADRAGLASALYLALVRGTNLDTASWQLSFRYGHVALPVSAAYPMTVALRRLEEDLTATVP